MSAYARKQVNKKSEKSLKKVLTPLFIYVNIILFLANKGENMKHIETKKGLTKLLERYLQAGVTDQTKDATDTYEAKWISAIKYCINEGLAMDEIDYENTPKELRKLWVGLK